MKIGYRTIKTAIGTPLAVTIAQLIGVTNIMSAGILTILCIQPSRKKSVESAWHRFIACLIAIVFSIVFFETLGYTPFTLAILLTLFIPTTVYLKIEKGIMTSTVITLNLYVLGSIQFSFIKEQIILIVIGIGTGLLMNLYMPSLDDKMKKKQSELEDNFQIILTEIARYIRKGNLDWSGKEFAHTGKILDEAMQLVELDKENHLFRDQHSYYNYFTMRNSQFEILENMLPLATRLPQKDDVSTLVADFFLKLADSIQPENTAFIFLAELNELRETFKQKELPQTQEEFETRASLFQLIHELEEYLKLKQKYKKPDVRKLNLKRKKKIKTNKF